MTDTTDTAQTQPRGRTPHRTEHLELETAYDTVRGRYPNVYWATDARERTITAYTIGDAEGACPLVTVCVDDAGLWIACVHAEPNPMTGMLYQLKNGKQTDAAPVPAILGLLDVYFSEMLATMLAASPTWTGGPYRSAGEDPGADETEDPGPVTPGPLDSHRRGLGRLTMH